ncbi:extensin family protein [Aminobacter sp. BE322]|uniref:extensin-like domain-containing protein n=1 Tax=unclassified Aminobacter TaxID=2644704 RepID=UPI003D1EAE02
MHFRKPFPPSLPVLTFAIAGFAVASVPLPASAVAVELPETAPLPSAAPTPPPPEPRPGGVRQGAIPIPQPRPPRADRLPQRPREPFGPPAPPKMLPDPRSGAVRPARMPPAEVACRGRLEALGAAFDEAAPEVSADGCALPFPIKLSRLSKSVDVEPDAIVNCATAEATARFATDIVAPAAKSTFGQELAGIVQASAYVCRPRNGTRKLSEHAFGNALDIAGFALAKGKAIAVEPAPPEENAKFLMLVRKAACGRFKTVLGPGSDADHARHLHLDLAPRRNGGIFCQ